MDLLLTGKVAIVSGSSRGIGKAIAGRLLAEGCEVYVTGRDSDSLESTRHEFYQQFGDKVHAYQGDLTDSTVLESLISSVCSRHQRLDIAVANIGSGQSKLGWDVGDDIWLQAFQTNFFAAVRLSREAIRVMCKNGGSIIFISSIAGVEAIAAPVPYSTAKAALLSYVANTARIVALHGIRLNSISPGNVLFPGGTWDRKMREDSNGVAKYIADTVPMNRFGRPEEIADAVAFLASEKAAFITGSNMLVDGGQTRRIF